MENNIKKLIKIISLILGNEKVLTIFELGVQDCNNTEIFFIEFTRIRKYMYLSATQSP